MIARLRRASTAIFVVHVVRTGLACLAIAPLWSLLDASPQSALDRGIRDDALVAALVMKQLPAALPFSLAALAAHALVAPYLQQLVLGCMQGLALLAASRRAATAYPKALLLSTVRWALLALTFAAFMLLVLRTNRLDSSAYAALIALLPGVLVGIVVGGAHDLCAAQLSQHAASRSDRSGSFWPSLLPPRLHTLAVYALSMIAVAAIALGGELLARSTLLLLAPSMLLFALQQSLSLLATFVRAAWLAVSLDSAPQAAATTRAPTSQAAEI